MSEFALFSWMERQERLLFVCFDVGKIDFKFFSRNLFLKYSLRKKLPVHIYFITTHMIVFEYEKYGILRIRDEK